MGTRDFGHREKKKAKKDTKKAPIISVAPPETVEVQVVKTKGKKQVQEEGE